MATTRGQDGSSGQAWGLFAREFLRAFFDFLDPRAAVSGTVGFPGGVPGVVQEFHMGEVAQVVCHLKDSGGNETDRYDKTTGIAYELTCPDQAEVIDDTVEPRHAQVRFNSLTPLGEDQFLNVSLDGDPGDGVRTISLQSDAFQVVPGDAVTGTVELHINPVEPEA